MMYDSDLIFYRKFLQQRCYFSKLELKTFDDVITYSKDYIEAQNSNFLDCLIALYQTCIKCFPKLYKKPFLCSKAMDF